MFSKPTSTTTCCQRSVVTRYLIFSPFLSPQNKKLLDFPHVTVSMRIESSRHCSTLTKIADINIQL